MDELTKAEEKATEARAIIGAAWESDVSIRTTRIADALLLLDRAIHKIGNARAALASVKEKS